MWDLHEEITINELVLLNSLTKSLGIIIQWYLCTQIKIYPFQV